MKANAVNLATFANALCHLNTTPLSVAVLAPCAWGENLARGVAWQGAFLGRSGAWQSIANSAKHNTAQRGEFGNETAQRGKFQRHDNKIQHNEFIKASTAQQIQQNTANLAVQTMHDKFGLASMAKMGSACRRSRQSENVAVFVGRSGQSKNGAVFGWGTSLSLSLSLSLSRCLHLWHDFGLNLKGFLLILS